MIDLLNPFTVASISVTTCCIHNRPFNLQLQYSQCIFFAFCHLCFSCLSSSASFDSFVESRERASLWNYSILKRTCPCLFILSFTLRGPQARPQPQFPRLRFSRFLRSFPRAILLLFLLMLWIYFRLSTRALTNEFPSSKDAPPRAATLIALRRF